MFSRLLVKEKGNKNTLNRTKKIRKIVCESEKKKS